MIRPLLMLVLLVALTAAAQLLAVDQETLHGNRPALLVGFILLASYLAGRIAQKIKLPRITGYLLAGILFGPHVLGAVWDPLSPFSPQALSRISLFNQVALGLIAFSAGGELRMEPLKSRLRSILWVTAGQTTTAFLLVLAAILTVGGLVPTLAGLNRQGLLGVGLVFSVLALANSPSTVIAVILEYRAQGPLTTTTLGVTVIKDMLVLMLFSLSMIAAELLLHPGQAADLALLGEIGWKIGGSLGLGVVLGILIGVYVRRVNWGLPLILLALAFTAMELGARAHLSGLLVCMVAGFYVQNFTYHGDELVESLERYALPIFVLFFTITGAQLQLPLLASVWPFVLLMVLVRGAAVWSGTTLGSRLAGDAPEVRKSLWCGFVAQAGVTLGLATLVRSNLPDLGERIATVAVAGVAVNQIIGPVLFRFGLIRSGETKG